MRVRTFQALCAVALALLPVRLLTAQRGCVTGAPPGDYTFPCQGWRVAVHVPKTCARPGCGLILEIHGDTGTGPLQDAHLRLRELGEAAGYVLVAPSHPRQTWSSTDDAGLLAITRQTIAAYRIDPRKVHVTGFSRGGYVAWRLLCDHADVFASAAPAAAGAGGGERTCFAGGRAPTRDVPILFLMGRTDHQVSYASMVQIRDAAIAAYGAGPPHTIAGDAAFTHTQWTGRNDVVIETFDHAYETIKDGPWGFALGHCIPGSTVDPRAKQYALPCKPPNAFVWGNEVMKFFKAHPMH